MKSILNLMCIKAEIFVFARFIFSNKHYPLDKDHNLELLKALNLSPFSRG